MTADADPTGIMNVLASYAHACDDDRFDDFQQLFVDDAVLMVAGEVVRGAPAIRAFVERHQNEGLRGRHLISNVHLSVDGDSADVASDFFLFQWRNGRLQVTRSGRYRDRLTREGGRWLFARKEAIITPRVVDHDEAPDRRSG